MGGLAGHMYHLYENPSLTFKEIKDIFKKASEGNLVGTEKTDGLNIYISYSVRTGKAKAARNKDNIKDGGVTADVMASKFDGKVAKEIFHESFKALEEAAATIPIEEQIDIFGPDANIYYNAEIQDPRNPNVIHYDLKSLTIHRSGHAEFDKSTGIVIDRNLNSEFNKLETALKNRQASENPNDYRVITNAVRSLKALSDKSALLTALSRLNQLQNISSVSDEDSIGQYLINVLFDQIYSEFSELPENSKKELLKRMMKVKGVTIVTVLKTVPREQRDSVIEKIKTYIDREKQIYKEAIQPLESIVHDFSVSMLEALESAFILDQGKEVARLKSELTKIRQQVQDSGDPKAMSILKTQLAKIKDVENIKTAAEGFVFSYNGESYKFTGNFAPLNQILGIFRYSRGTKPLTEISVSKDSKTAVVTWGRFNPPTVGHELLFNFAKSVADKDGSDYFIIPTRSTDNKDNPLEPEDKMHYLKLMFPQFSSNVINNTSINTIFNAAKLLSDAGYSNLKIVVGEDRVKNFEMLNKYNNQGEFSFESIEVISAGKRDPDADDVTGMSASKMRKAAVDGNLSTFSAGLPDTIDDKIAREIMNKIRTKTPVGRGNSKKFLNPIDEILSEQFSIGTSSMWYTNEKKNVCEDKEYIEENSMGSGAIAGSPANNVFNQSMQSRYGQSLGKRDDETPEELYITAEDKDMTKSSIDREAFIQEIQLRKVVREAIQKKTAEKKAKQAAALNEEMQLRLLIRKLLKEGEEDSPHNSTGINVLSDLLKKIMKTIEIDFKALTTDSQQRQSFRAHVINAVKNSLATVIATDDADVDVKLAEQTEMQPDAPQDPRFIDVGLDKKKKKEPQDTFTIPGQDVTGRNMALKTFDKVEKNITDSYNMLSNQKDKDLFYDYLITNLKLYFDKFESEMQPSAPTVDSATYDAEKQKVDSIGQSQPATAPVDPTAAGQLQ